MPVPVEKAEAFVNKRDNSTRSHAFCSGMFSGRESTQQLQDLLTKVTQSLWNLCCC